MWDTGEGNQIALLFPKKMLFIKEDSLFEIGGILSAQKGYYLEKYLPREQASNAGGFDSKIVKEAETEAGI